MKNRARGAALGERKTNQKSNFLHRKFTQTAVELLLQLPREYLPAQEQGSVISVCVRPTCAEHTRPRENTHKLAKPIVALLGAVPVLDGLILTGL